ncbi:MAG: FlgO family outer membrane protein [Psychrobium sp.]
MTLRKYLMAFALLALGGCQTIDTIVGKDKPMEQPIEVAIESISQQLITNPVFSIVDKRIVSSTFVWSDTLTSVSKDSEQMELGTILQESIITSLIQAGADVREIKSANAIQLDPTGEFILSRDIDKVADNTHADYVLTGIMTPTEYGTIVNAKLINLHNKRVVAAARQIIAIVKDTQMTENSSKFKNGMLYRSHQAQGNHDE